MLAVEAERMATVVFVAVTAPVAAVVMLMSSKHACFRSCFVISKLQIYRIDDTSRAISDISDYVARQIARETLLASDNESPFCSAPLIKESGFRATRDKRDRK
jgi:hypothetical protein